MTAPAMLTKDTGNTFVCIAERITLSVLSQGCYNMGRRGVLRRERQCFVCLMRGHCSSEYQSIRKYQMCGRKHHQSICEQENPSQLPTTTGDDASKDVTHVTTSSVARTKNHLLLQTAHVRDYTADNHLVPVRVLLDSGSQYSYITNTLKDTLKLTPLRQEQLVLNTFGSTGCRKENSDVIMVTLQGRRGEDVKIQALNFPDICSLLQTEVDVNQRPHLMNLDLADEDNDDACSDSIDILIGSDFYWHVVIGDIV